MTENNKPISSKMKKDAELTPNDMLKYEIAEELGFMDKVNKLGWKSLTARESGKIGGIMTKKKREMKKQENASQ